MNLAQRSAGTSTKPNATALSIQGVSRRFGTTLALDDVTLQIGRGEIICLVGHSGCGKTSLLRSIAGIDTPDEGRISAGETDFVSPLRFLEPEKRNVGVVFQDYALFPHLTVLENVLFGLRNISKVEARQRATEMLEMVGLAQMLDRYPHMLSGGEQQRVALARALVTKPNLLLMDEPFSNLDRGLRERVRGETVDLLRKLGITAIIVTHEAEEALSTGDRVVLMQSGSIVQNGTPFQIYDQPNCRYAAEFFGNFNVFEGNADGEKVTTKFGSFKYNTDNSGPVKVFLRSEDVSLLPVERDAQTLEHHGIIEKRAFYGHDEDIIVRMVENDQLVRARTSNRIPVSASDLVVQFDWEKAHIFP